MAGAVAQGVSPFERIGGRKRLSQVVDRFYALMDEDPAYASLRAMHADDLSPMRSSLTDFLTAWMGGPRDWFEQRPGACIMSAHARLGVTRETADQWVAAMSRALRDTVDDAPLVEAMLGALTQMSRGMARTSA